MRAPKVSELRDPQDALRAYLDEMLHLATAVHPVETRAETRRIECQSRPEAGSIPASNTGAAIEVVAPPRPVEPAAALKSVAVAARPVAPALKAVSARRSASGSPADRFRFPLQCLMFRLGEHQLALPLIELAGVIRAETRLTRLPQLPAEVSGLLRHRGRTLRVVDSAALLGILGASDARRCHLLLLAAGDWALTCDAPGQVAYLARDDVQWRSGDCGRLRYGTIRESLVTLLDPGAICARLERGRGAKLAPRPADNAVECVPRSQHG